MLLYSSGVELRNPVVYIIMSLVLKLRDCDCPFILIMCVFFFFLLSSTNLPWNHCLRKELFIFGTLSMLWQRTIIADGFALLGFDWGLCYYLTLNTILKEKVFFFFTLVFEKLCYRKQYIIVLSLDREHKVLCIVYGSLNAFQQKNNWHFKFIANSRDEFTDFFT